MRKIKFVRKEDGWDVQMGIVSTVYAPRVPVSSLEGILDETGISTFPSGNEAVLEFEDERIANAIYALVVKNRTDIYQLKGGISVGRSDRSPSDVAV